MSRTACALALLAAPALADVKLYQNDSLPAAGGGTIACQAGFASNEIGAAVFTVPPADGKVLLLEAQFWACDGSGLGFATARPVQVNVYPAGGPNPGAASYVSPTLTAVPGFLNLWPLEAEDLSFGSGNTFTVGVKLLNGGLFQNFTTLATDSDGCQPAKSLIFAIPGGWTDACSLGVSGDMFVRARVLTEGPGAVDDGGSFAVECSGALAGAPGFLGYSTSSASLPLFGGTVLINPAGLGAAFLPVVASPGGAASVGLPIPGGNPGLIGLHIYFQYGFLDAGGPLGVSMSAGLDVKLSSNG